MKKFKKQKSISHRNPAFHKANEITLADRVAFGFEIKLNYHHFEAAISSTSSLENGDY